MEQTNSPADMPESTQSCLPLGEGVNRRLTDEGSPIITPDETQPAAQPIKTAQKGYKRFNKISPVMWEAAIYIAVFIVTVVFFFAIKPQYSYWRNGSIAQRVVVFVIGCTLLVGVFLAFYKKLNVKRIVILMMIIGIALRLGYMLYTPASSRQYDTFSSGNNGHAAYALTIFSTGKLPTNNSYQFYHPPLNALMQAGFMKIVSAFSSLLGAGDSFFSKYSAGCPSYMGAEEYYLYQSCQILSVMYSVITMVVLLKLLRKFNLSGTSYVFAAAIVIFFPRHIQFAGQLNNDALCYLFAVLALYYTVCWWKGKKGFAYITAAGFAVGLGMMTKLTSATVCIPMAGVFILEFVRTLRKKEGSLRLKKMIGEYCAFLIPAALIGLWFQVYAYVRFGQGLGFVFGNLVSSLYTGDYSVTERFIFAWDDTFYLYCTTHNGNYNLFNFALHSALFGEFGFWNGECFSFFAVVCAYAAVFIFAVALVWALYLFFRYDIKDKSEEAADSKKNIFFTFLLLQSQVLSLIYFYIKMPYSCTMDFRYIMPMILVLALMGGMVHKRLARHGGKFSLVISRLTVISVSAMLVSTSLFYMVCI